MTTNSKKKKLLKYPICSEWKYPGRDTTCKGNDFLIFPIISRKNYLGNLQFCICTHYKIEIRSLWSWDLIN